MKKWPLNVRKTRLSSTCVWNLHWLKIRIQSRGVRKEASSEKMTLGIHDAWRCEFWPIHEQKIRKQFHFQKKKHWPKPVFSSLFVFSPSYPFVVIIFTMEPVPSEWGIWIYLSQSLPGRTSLTNYSAKFLINPGCWEIRNANFIYHFINYVATSVRNSNSLSSSQPPSRTTTLIIDRELNLYP